MRHILGALALGGFLLAGPSASAEGPDYIKLKALLPPGPDAILCLARTYDKDHLKKHPKQRVTELILFIRYITLGEDEATLIATDDGGIEKQYFGYDFTFAAKVRDRTETLYASGDCVSAEAIGCDVECDGGGIVLKPIPDDRDAVLMQFSENGYVRMTPGCGGEEDAVELRPGEDDKLFKLEKAPVETCNAMQAEFAKGLE